MLKHRIKKLEQAIDDVGAAVGKCRTCFGFGPMLMYRKPHIGLNPSGSFAYGEPVLLPDDRYDAEGRCVGCGAAAKMPAVVLPGLPPDLEAMCRALDERKTPSARESGTGRE